MPRKGRSNEEIVHALHQVECGEKVAEVCRRLGVSEQTFYRWKKRFARRLRSAQRHPGADGAQYWNFASAVDDECIAHGERYFEAMTRCAKCYVFHSRVTPCFAFGTGSVTSPTSTRHETHGLFALSRTIDRRLSLATVLHSVTNQPTEQPLDGAY